ncbi:outer membrane pore protein F|uniref:Outer membrane pore protein F n=1 Tax=Brenneria salicis ATCC 15712 = DSM 30166 TaxID=714314 RepID=A0A366I552_9GAMM|nr:porin [Brenneria salicis]NMN91412.1 outer membrane pore protein F [Brenneria salicis ATCC 15712 = DSM 30166]RBP61745.1 outer membrane pore protein F [Brenneria salicis ATCC 15712 = DSM 30166]RLM30504.1 porin [Brenneria salicis ATCC 15712 = DSM 30166]
MMKRNILAVVVPALLAAGAANAAEVYNKDGNKLDVYGRVHAGYTFVDGDGDNSDNTYARLGFKGETQITDQLTGYGRFEYQFDGNTAEDNSVTRDDKTRYAFAGFKFGDYGSFDYGRNYSVAYDSLAITDVLPENGGDSAVTDTLTGRIGNAATFRNSDFFGLVDGLDFGLQYIAKDEDSSTRIDRIHGDAWASSLSYESDIGIGVVASYGSYVRTSVQQGATVGAIGGKKADVWAAGVKYDANNIYLAATYGEGTNFYRINGGNGIADKSKVFEAVAQYNFDFGLTPTLAYVSRKDKVDSPTATNSGRNDYAVKYASVGATYAFNKNISTYAEYDINLIDSDNAYGISDDDVINIGVIYQF